ncbi:MAG TPA: hypothetical protein VFS20_10185 [Longimicrobium sp.]|nr:hypothetical protein [Longimicrobium sp.]
MAAAPAARRERIERLDRRANAGSTAPRLKRGVVLQRRGEAFRAAQPV